MLIAKQQTTDRELCSLCGKKHPNPPHDLEMMAIDSLDLHLCPPCYKTMRRVILEVINELRDIRGIGPIRYPEMDWR